MKKLVLLVVLALGVAGIATAQESTTVTKTERQEVSESKGDSFWSNCWISVGGGAQMLFSDHDKQMDFGDRLSPALDIAVGKWITPAVGVRLMYSGFQLKGATQNGAHSTGKGVPGKDGHGYWLSNQKFNYFNIHGDVMLNLTNLICGYNPKRVYNISPYLGLGVLRVYDSPTDTEVGGMFGIYNTFRLSDSFDINFDIRGVLIADDDFDGENGTSGDHNSQEEGILSATIGLTYKFKPQGWKKKVVTIYNETELNAMREKLNAMNAENERLRNQAPVTNTVETIVEKEVFKNTVAPCMVAFEINKSDLSKDARVNLGMFADGIKKADKSIVYTVTGYADEGTGNSTINERLSKERAQVVYDCLTKEFGVDPVQLRVEFKGGVGNMFYDDPKLSRSVIVKQAE